MILKHVKDRIQVINFMKKVTETMRIISASKIKSYEKILVNSTQYLNFIKNSILHVYFNYEDFENYFNQFQKYSPSILLIIFGTDKSLCGSFNSKITRKIASSITSNTKLFCIGNNTYQNIKFNYKKYIL